MNYSVYFSLNFPFSSNCLHFSSVSTSCLFLMGVRLSSVIFVELKHCYFRVAVSLLSTGNLSRLPFLLEFLRCE